MNLFNIDEKITDQKEPQEIPDQQLASRDSRSPNDAVLRVAVPNRALMARHRRGRIVVMMFARPTLMMIVINRGPMRQVLLPGMLNRCMEVGKGCQPLPRRTLMVTAV